MNLKLLKNKQNASPAELFDSSLKTRTGVDFPSTQKSDLAYLQNNISQKYKKQTPLNKEKTYSHPETKLSDSLLSISRTFANLIDYPADLFKK